MKKFSIPIKKAIDDFTVTNDLWLTINDKKGNYTIIKKDNPSELFIGLTLNTNTSMEKQAGQTEDLKNLFEVMTENVIQASFLYVNSSENRVLCSSPLDVHFLLIKRSDKTIIDLNKEKKAVKIDADDIIMLLSRKIPEEAMENLKSFILKKNYISYNMLKHTASFLESMKLSIIPLLIIDKTEHKSHSYPIESSIKTIDMTIDMMKNKILQYHTKKIWQIETVLHEALVNAITYGNGLDSEKSVLMSYEIGPKGLRIIIKDCGEGFDVNNIFVPVGVEALERISGRGIYIMKKFSDAIFYNQSGNELIFFFSFV